MYVVGEPRVHLRAQMCVRALHSRARPRVAANPARIDISPRCLGTTNNFLEFLENSWNLWKIPGMITRRPKADPAREHVLTRVPKLTPTLEKVDTARAAPRLCA